MYWQIVLLIILAIAVSFGFVLISGAPYVPTLKKQIKTALELAKLNPGATIIELGSGDGRVLIAAAKLGLNVVGYELNPLLYLISWIRCRPYRANIKLHYGNFWSKRWPSADAVYVFLLPRLMSRLEQKIISEQSKTIKVISFAFAFPGRKIFKQKDGVFLYLFKVSPVD